MTKPRAPAHTERGIYYEHLYHHLYGRARRPIGRPY